jgi:tetratricopeptide (TPR) repeat protein
MPFVGKNSSKAFIGRRKEIHFFLDKILLPLNPEYNIVSFSGQGGIGKSKLLLRFIEETHCTDCEEYCLSALVNEQQVTPARVMERFAQQLHLSGNFDKTLKYYKSRLLKQQNQQESMLDTALQKVPDIAGAAAEIVPLAGPLLREGIKATADYVLNDHHLSQIQKDVEFLENPLSELTRSFVAELNSLATSWVKLSTKGEKRQRRILLFFDSFEQTAIDIIPWLLDQFLEAEINNNIVLVIAGRDSLDRLTPGDAKRWFAYYEDHTIYYQSLSGFTDEETRSYLSLHGIKDSKKIERILCISHGLPLYLRLLTFPHPEGVIDPTKGVVDNFLNGISKQEPLKLRIALDAALLSRPFNQDDLKAFLYLSSDQERATIFQWLIEQPFIVCWNQEGRYLYHDQVRTLFGCHLYQSSPDTYYAVRSSLAQNYQEQLDKCKSEGGNRICSADEWLSLTIGLVKQLFLLPDDLSHIKAIKLLLTAYKFMIPEQVKGIVRGLHELVHEQSIYQVDTHTKEVVLHILCFINSELVSQQRLDAVSALLEEMNGVSLFPAHLRAQLHTYRSRIHLSFQHYEHARADIDHALEIDPNYVEAYNSRGWIHWYLRNYQSAIENFNHALRLQPDYVPAYNGRGWTYSRLKEYQRAVGDFEQALALAPSYVAAYYGLGWVYIRLKEYQQGIEDFRCTLVLDPAYTSDYYQRGLVSLWLNDLQQARADFLYSWRLHPFNISYGWMAEWVYMCQVPYDLQTRERLSNLVDANPQSYQAWICRAVILGLQGNWDSALAKLEEAIQLDEEESDAYFWKGLVCASIKRYDMAITALEKARELGLPPILSTPLLWLKESQPDFVRKAMKIFFNDSV